ncbi:DUF2630 family protein [Arthrobacter pigmenti]
MEQEQILEQVRLLVDREHQLREQRQTGELGAEEERAEIRRIEETLDQCWDLLRQRRAQTEFGQDADNASPRPASTVETYDQ